MRRAPPREPSQPSRSATLTRRRPVSSSAVGDNCCDPGTMGCLQRFMEASIPGVYVHSIMVGGGPTADTLRLSETSTTSSRAVRPAPRRASPREWSLSASPRARSSSARSSAAAAASVGRRRSSSAASSHGRPARGRSPPRFAVRRQRDPAVFARQRRRHEPPSTPFTRASVVQAQYSGTRRDTRSTSARTHSCWTSTTNATTRTTHTRRTPRAGAARVIRFSEDTVVVPREAPGSGRTRWVRRTRRRRWWSCGPTAVPGRLDRSAQGRRAFPSPRSTARAEGAFHRRVVQATRAGRASHARRPGRVVGRVLGEE